MAEIVAAVATSHILMSPAGADAAAARVFEGMQRVGRHVQAARPDVIVLVSNDHMFNIGPEASAPFFVGCAPDYVPFGEMDIPREEYRGDPRVALGLADHCQRRGLALERLAALKPDHGIAVPLLFVNPRREAAVVPVLVNHSRDGGIPPTECWYFGQLLGEYLAALTPATLRVALVGAGGLSHRVGYDTPRIDEDFDRAFLADFERGNLGRWRRMGAAEIEAVAGNGGVEIMNWMIVAAAVPRAAAETVYYEPMPSWMTGMGGAVLRLPHRAAG
jgi:aromatic ring-opening dioxygenase catalytic subunit (LigB family)